MPKKELKYIGFLSLFLLFIVGLIKFSFTFLVPIIIGFLIALILNPLVKFLTKKLKLKREISIMILIIGVLFLFIGLVMILANWLTTDISSIIDNFPSNYNKLKQVLMDKVEILNNLPFIQRNFSFGTILEKLDIGNYISILISKIVSIGSMLPDMIVKFIFIILFSFFFILKMDNIKDFILSRISVESQEKVKAKVKELVGGYFIAQGKLLIIMFIVLYIAFLILKLPYAFLLALVTSVLDSLPIFGTGAILIPYSIIELLYKNYYLALGIILTYFIAQFVKRILEPKVLGNTIGLDTFNSVLCLFLGYQFLGVIGLIVGIPVGVIIKDCYKIGIFDRLFESIKIIKSWILNEIKV